MFSLYLISFLVGFTSIAYQIIWERMLRFHFGGDHVTAGLSVATLLFGYGIGAYLAGQWSYPAKRVAALCLLTGIFGALSPYIMSLLRNLMPQGMGLEHIAIMRPLLVVGAMLFLLGPGILFGAQSILVFRLFTTVNRKPQGLVSLYGTHLAGAGVAAFGCACLLLPHFRLGEILILIATVDFYAAWILWRRYWGASNTDTSVAPSSINSESIIWCGLSGFLGAALEVILFRLADLLNPSSAYNYPIVLYLCLIFLSLGCFVSQRERSAPYRLFIGSAALYISAILFFAISWGFHRTHTGEIPWILAFAGIALIAVPLISWGGVLPLLLQTNPSRVSTLFMSNAIGALLGALGVQFLFLPVFGTGSTMLSLVFIGIAIGHFQRPRRHLPTLAVSMMIAISLPCFYRGKELFAVGLDFFLSEGFELVEGETGSAWIAFSKSRQEGTIKISGRQMGQIPMTPIYALQISYPLVHKMKNSVLMLGLGVGTYLRALLSEPDVHHIDISEWSHESPALFSKESVINIIGTSLTDARVHLYPLDARILVEQARTSSYDLIVDNMGLASWAAATHLKTPAHFLHIARILRNNGIFMTGLAGPAQKEILAGLITQFKYVYEVPKVYIALASQTPIEFELSQVQSILNTLCHSSQSVEQEKRCLFQKVIEPFPVGPPQVDNCQPLADDLLAYEFSRTLWRRAVRQLYGLCP